MIQLAGHAHVATRARALGSHRDRDQSGHRRRHLSDAVAGGRRDRRLEPDRFRADGARIAHRRAVLRGSRQPLREHRWTVSLYARGVRAVRRVRGRMDAMVHARRQSGERDGRHRGGARLLLAGRHRRLATDAAAPRRHRGADLGQRARHPPERVARQRADDRQARAAFALHHRRHLLHRAVAPHIAGADFASPGVHCSAAADLRLRRLRRRARAGRRGDRSAAARAVRADRDDSVGDGRDDTRPGGGAGRAARSRGAQHADCRCVGRDPRRGRRAARRRRISRLDDRQ